MTNLQDRFVAAKFRPSGSDYVRIELATGVIWLHSIEVTSGMDAALANWSSWARPLVGVILPMFFALSGFLVAGSLERNKSMISFLGLRVIRLMPALAVEIILSAIIFGPIFADFTLANYYDDARFWQYFGNLIGDIHYVLPGVFNANPYPQVVGSQLWTIPFELMCYLTLTVIAGVGLFGARRWLLALMVLLQVAVAVRLCIHGSHYEATVRGVLLSAVFWLGLLSSVGATKYPGTATLLWQAPYRRRSCCRCRQLATFSSHSRRPASVIVALPWSTWPIALPSSWR